ncbi:5-formyltetrahydrofolate cyclo-ligase [Streptomyces sp. NPDC001795]|uniref:5-formyltetrahydrofolate cyclo-ligase n=1 Tax=Streptomyces sp. NPDC001795 TaxID=3154525 RepID=UPI00332F39C7
MNARCQLALDSTSGQPLRLPLVVAGRLRNHNIVGHATTSPARVLRPYPAVQGTPKAGRHPLRRARLDHDLYQSGGGGPCGVARRFRTAVAGSHQRGRARDGARIGKGASYSDLEFALLTEAGLIGPGTLVVTTVHSLQVIDAPIPVTDHDVKVDLVITPTRSSSAQPHIGRRGSCGTTLTRPRSLLSLHCSQG